MFAYIAVLNAHVLFVRDRIREQYKDFHEAFSKYDKRRKGYLTVSDVQRLLVDFNYFLDDDQFYDLLQQYVQASSSSSLSHSHTHKCVTSISSSSSSSSSVVCWLGNVLTPMTRRWSVVLQDQAER